MLRARRQWAAVSEVEAELTELSAQRGEGVVWSDSPTRAAPAAAEVSSEPSRERSLSELRRDKTVTKVRALRMRSWHLKTNARLCLVIVLLEDVPQLVFVSVVGRLDTGRAASAISLVGIGVSVCWAVFNWSRGRMARTHASRLQERSAPAGTSSTGESSGDAELAI